MVARQRRPAEFWQEVVEDFLKSGLLQKEYAQEHNICRATLSAWIRRLRVPLGQNEENSEVEGKEGCSLPLSFIDVESLGRMKISPSLKMEISFPQGHRLKIEADGGWEEAGVFVKALVR
jgi:transposase-like protein